jgi:penicillin amidase
MTPDPPHNLQPFDPDEPRLVTRGNALNASAIAAEHESPRAALFAKLRRPRRPHVLRWAAILACALLVLAACTLLLVSVSLRHAMQASLPQMDGTLHAAGLAQPVSITRDAQGVPSISGTTLDDTLFAQGFITAQDRLWQMDMLRRHASGNLAELLGASMVSHDRLQRTLRIRAAADNAIANLPPDQMHQLEAYARGVNAFIAQSASHLPVEFHLLHYVPAPWLPRDSLLVYLAMVQDLSTGFPVKLRREVLAQHLPPQLLADLYPVGSWRDRFPTQPPPDLATPVDEVEQIPLDRSQSRLALPAITAPTDILRLAAQLPAAECTECRAGSNNWAVAGARSASGQPLLSNDMHLNLTVPDIWYEAVLHAPGLDVAGFTLPGIPLIIVGRNKHVAWGFTNLGGDVQDVRVEHTRGSGRSMQFEQMDGTWADVGHHAETIVVRGGTDVKLDVVTTTSRFGAAMMSARAPMTAAIETPIITALLPSEHRMLSLAWTIYDPGNVTDPFLAVNTASDGAALVQALSSFGAPSLNLVYADDQHHIGYHAIGAIPIRGAAIQQTKALAPIIPLPPAADAETSEEDQDADNQDVDNRNADPQDANSEGSEDSEDTASTAALPAPAETLTYTIGSPIAPVPVDALDASQVWSGYVPYAALPAVVDPPNGFIATANSRITPPDYPYALALNWAPPYRTERIYKLLGKREHLTPADMLATQMDVHSEFDLVFAQRLAYAIDHASPAVLAHNAAQLHQAANILRDWQGDVSVDAVAPSLVTAARAELLPMLVLPQIAAHDKAAKIKSKPADVLALYNWGGETVAVENFLEHTPARWRPAGFATWNDVLATALLRALRGAHAPADLSTWHYGQLHKLELTHPVLGLTPLFDRMLGVRTGTGPQLIGGDGTTIRALGGHVGPSERFTADLADPQMSLANITTGESGNPASPHYLDQFQAWLKGTTFVLPLTFTQPAHTLTLLP